jgi:hypothetical protein
MSSTPASISSLSRIEKVLELLYVIRSNAPREKTQQLALEATKIVVKMRGRFEDTRLGQLVQMVLRAEWDTVNEILKIQFPTTLSKSGAIKQVLVLVNERYNEWIALKWVKHLQGGAATAGLRGSVRDLQDEVRRQPFAYASAGVAEIPQQEKVRPRTRSGQTFLVF